MNSKTGAAAGSATAIPDFQDVILAFLLPEQLSAFIDIAKALIFQTAAGVKTNAYLIVDNGVSPEQASTLVGGHGFVASFPTLPNSQSDNFNPEQVMLSVTVPVNEGQPIFITTGISTTARVHGWAIAFWNPLGDQESFITSIVLTEQQSSATPTPPAPVPTPTHPPTQTPAPITNTLRSVAMVSATDGWIVGDSGTILQWDGSRWRAVKSPTTNNLYSIALVSPNDSLAVGGNYPDTNLLRWDGTQWILWKTFPNVRVMSMASVSEGWGLDDLDNIVHWDGNDWTITFTPRAMFTSFIAGAVNNVWATLNNGVKGYGPGTVLHWDGHKWQELYPTDAEGNGLSLMLLDVVSATDIWAIGTAWQPGKTGNFYVWKAVSGKDQQFFHWNGTTWDLVNNPSKVSLSQIIMVSPTDGWGVGDSGAILHWDGSSWNLVSSSTTSDLHSVALASSIDGWAVGDKGTILRWNGSEWIDFNPLPSEIIPTPTPRGTLAPTATPPAGVASIAGIWTGSVTAGGEGGSPATWDEMAEIKVVCQTGKPCLSFPADTTRQAIPFDNEASKYNYYCFTDYQEYPDVNGKAFLSIYRGCFSLQADGTLAYNFEMPLYGGGGTLFKQSSPQATQLPNNSPRIYDFSACLQPCNGANTMSTFPQGSTKIYAQWNYENIPAGVEYIRAWAMNGQEWVRYSCIWPGPQTGIDTVTLTEPKGLYSGTWEMTIIVNGQVLLEEQIQVEGDWTYWDPAGSFDTCYRK